MSSDNGNRKEPSGPIAYMAGNSVAANVMMIAIIAFGVVSFFLLEREAWADGPFLPCRSLDGLSRCHAGRG